MANVISGYIVSFPLTESQLLEGMMVYYINGDHKEVLTLNIIKENPGPAFYKYYLGMVGKSLEWTNDHSQFQTLLFAPEADDEKIYNLNSDQWKYIIDKRLLNSFPYGRCKCSISKVFGNSTPLATMISFEPNYKINDFL